MNDFDLFILTTSLSINVWQHISGSGSLRKLLENSQLRSTVLILMFLLQDHVII